MKEIIPAPRTPFIDARTGLIAREWYLFLLTTVNRVGAAESDINAAEYSPIDQYDRAVELVTETLHIQDQPPLADHYLSLPQRERDELCQEQAIQPQVSDEKYEPLPPPVNSMAGQSIGITTTITTDLLVGKTITVTNGIITAFA